MIELEEFEEVELEDIAREDVAYRGGLNHYCYTVRDCEKYGCDYICRCSKIESVDVNTELYFWLDLFNETSIAQYPVMRLLLATYLQTNWKNQGLLECDTGAGYYGEELYGINFLGKWSVLEFLKSTKYSYSEMIKKCWPNYEEEELLNNFLESECEWKLIEIDGGQISFNGTRNEIHGAKIEEQFSNNLLISVSKTQKLYNICFLDYSLTTKQSQRFKDLKYKIIVPTEL